MLNIWGSIFTYKVRSFSEQKEKGDIPNEKHRKMLQILKKEKEKNTDIY